MSSYDGRPIDELRDCIYRLESLLGEANKEIERLNCRVKDVEEILKYALVKEAK